MSTYYYQPYLMLMYYCINYLIHSITFYFSHITAYRTFQGQNETESSYRPIESAMLWVMQQEDGRNEALRRF